ncbi:MAG: hypothetical protein R2912_09535 [Eubacteriales bacterium]
MEIYRFADVLSEEPGGVDLDGAYVVPGFIDIHLHGNSGHDFSDGDFEGLTAIARYLAKNGITSFMPASVTLEAD